MQQRRNASGQLITRVWPASLMGRLLNLEKAMLTYGDGNRPLAGSREWQNGGEPEYLME